MSAQTSASKRGRLKSYFKGVRSEMRKVIWPNRKVLANHTGIVIIISIIVALIVWALDLGIHRVLSLFI
ncbi:MAG: preprotein translocase subunit SecE [Tissierellia bacterium]|nr:preprotein translocase subunit SecE [Tissierellia bacterium]